MRVGDRWRLPDNPANLTGIADADPWTRIDASRATATEVAVARYVPVS